MTAILAKTTRKKLFNWEQMNGKLYSNGWRDGTQIVNAIKPATGKTIAQVAQGSAELIAEAASIAAKAQKEWARVPAEEKRALLLRADALLHEYADEIREITMREIGATHTKAQFEINFSSDEFREASAYPTQHYGALLADRANRKSYAVRIPYGVVAVLTPSNVPLLLAARVIAPALAMGNAVLLRPHPNDTELGLSGAVIGSALRATHVAEQLQTGMIHINDRSTDDSAYVPFGGVKLSGNGGRCGSYVNWDEYTQWRWFTVSDKPTLVPFTKE